MLTGKPRFPILDIIIFGFLPSWLKRIIYRIRGYRIGRGVSIGFGSVVCGKNVLIGKGTSIGFFSFVRGQEITIGDRVTIKSGTMIDTPYLEIGDDTQINEQVFIGGLQFPDSRLTIGKNCQIMQMTFINPAKWIKIGNDTGIGGNSLIFGHTSWLSRFEGYSVDFRPIEIGNSVSVAWRVFITAGAKIGDGAVIGANSLVNRAIPPQCLATGSPAKVVAKAPYFPRVVSDEEKISYLKEIAQEMVQYLVGSGISCQTNESVSFIQVNRKRRRWLSNISEELSISLFYEHLSQKLIDDLPVSTVVFLSLRTIESELRVLLEDSNIMWIDIESKMRSTLSNELGEETIDYLKRYGVRLSRS